MSESTSEQMPQAALDDYREYARMGGRFGVATWWERYKDDYQAVTSDA